MPAAASVAVASAMAGIVLGGIVGGPVGTLIDRSLQVAQHCDSITNGERRHRGSLDRRGEPRGRRGQRRDVCGAQERRVDARRDVGRFLGRARDSSELGITLPAYIGAMLVAAVIRNVDDATGWLGLSTRIIDVIGAVALSLFLVLALMTLETVGAGVTGIAARRHDRAAGRARRARRALARVSRSWAATMKRPS